MKQLQRSFMSTTTPTGTLRVIVHRGTNEIGSSCIEVASASTRIILDCGWPLGGGDESEPPTVPGLFAPGSKPAAVLLSHAHPDHTGFIGKIPGGVPIYATVDTSKIMKVGSIYARGVELPRDQFEGVNVPRSWRDPVRHFPIGDLQITAYPVDHSSPGAVGYLVEHAGKRIFYTGDLRFHGRKSGMHERILKDLRSNLDLLITEGTNVGREQSGLGSEKEVENRAVELSREASLMMVAYSPQNLDRFVSFFRAAVRAGKTFVCDHYQAAVLQQLNNPKLPKPGDELRVYLPRIRASLVAYESRLGDSTISLDAILATPERFMMLVRKNILENDLSGKLPRGSRLLYGMWSGYRADPKWQKTEQMLAAAGCELIACHASGHAHESDLLQFILDLRPRRVVPVHTERLESFKDLVPRVEVVEDGQPVQL